MKPGIDPKNDYVFKWLFGREARLRLLLDLVNAVLDLSPGRRIAALEIRNPYNDKEAPDDKLSILDIRARDEKGRQYNIEMQMQGGSILVHRLLYYWAQVHADQLKEGEDFRQLRTTISICFLNSVLFAEVPDYHLHFELRSALHPHLLYSDHQSMHLVQLPKLKTRVEELVGPMEAWCYFLIHGEALDTASLPDTLRTALVPEAMEALVMFTQDEIERARYLSRKMAYLDRLTAERETSEAREEARAERENARAERENARAERENAREAREKAIEEREKGKLLGRIQAFQSVLKEPQTSEDELAAMSIPELQALANELEKRLPQQK